MRGVIVQVGIALAAFAFSAGASAAPGVGSFSGKDSLKVSGCGKDGGAITIEIAIDANGGWSADANGNTFSGTSTSDPNGKTVTFTFDTPSRALLAGNLAADASSVCDEAVTIGSLTITSATLKLNKRLTGGKLQVAVTASGTTASGSGTGKYSIKASGTWQPAP